MYDGYVKELIYKTNHDLKKMECGYGGMSYWIYTNEYGIFSFLYTRRQLLNVTTFNLLEAAQHIIIMQSFQFYISILKNHEQLPLNLLRIFFFAHVIKSCWPQYDCLKFYNQGFT